MFPNDVSVIICGQGQLYKVPSVTQKEMSECWPQSIPGPKGQGLKRDWRDLSYVLGLIKL